jgi:ubiquinone/menaquinone biosynthesis C-methylase UbiE
MKGCDLIKKTFVSVSRTFPKLRQFLWKILYQLIAGLYRNPEWTFMNFGYAPVGSDESMPELLPEDEPERSFIQLYHHVIADVPMRGKDLIEIGCGRGGGCSYLGRYLQPRTVCGVDLSENAVLFCRKRHPVSAVRFVVGDSEKLPFPDESFDAAVNVESSHCYQSMERFIGEVRRILRPGGTFHLADLRDDDMIDEFHSSVEACGLRIERRVDITRNVSEAVRVDGARRVAFFHRTLPRFFARYFEEFAGNEGTAFYRRLVSGKVFYYSYLLRKV